MSRASIPYSMVSPMRAKLRSGLVAGVIVTVLAAGLALVVAFAAPRAESRNAKVAVAGPARSLPVRRELPQSLPKPTDCEAQETEPVELAPMPVADSSQRSELPSRPELPPVQARDIVRTPSQIPGIADIPLQLPDITLDLRAPPRKARREAAPELTPVEVEGDDLQGVHFRLSAYRGNVVVLHFWTSWCGYCRQQFPHERQLARRLAGSPFALIGINCDDNRETALRMVLAERLPGRSFWDGADGPIRQQLRVTAFPTFAVLDHRGHVRYRDVKGRQLDAAIDVLLAEAVASR
jgi:thiol-disulfide isomerase/thioredoxin